MTPVDERAEQGPFLIVGALAQQRTVDPEGRLNGVTAIVHHLPIVNQGPEEMPPIRAKVYATLLLIAGEGRAKSFSLEVQPEAPSGKRLPRVGQSFEFPDHEQAAVTCAIEMQPLIEEIGHYWFDVILAPLGAGGEERLLTRMPLLVSYQQANA